MKQLHKITVYNQSRDGWLFCSFPADTFLPNSQLHLIMRFFTLLCRGLLLAAILPLGTAIAQTSSPSPYKFSTVSGLANLGSADGAAETAQFSHPRAVAVDSKGNTFVADTDNSTIRKISAAGMVSTFAGVAGSLGSADGNGSTAARFSKPSGLAIDLLTDTIYVSDTGNNTIRTISPAGVVSTLAGAAGSLGFSDGTGTSARFNIPIGLAVSDDGQNIYVADTGNNIIRMVTATGTVTTVAGVGMMPSNGHADATGPGAKATDARFSLPNKLIVDGSGNIFIADTSNHTIRKISSSGVVTTLAGSPGLRGSTDGIGSAARFDYPTGLALDSSGNNLYVADMLNDAIRRVVIASGQVTTMAGAPGVTGSVDGIGTSARFNRPRSLTVDGSGNVFVADTSNSTIRKIAPDSTVTTFAGVAGSQGSVDGTGTAALFSFPSGLATDSAGNIYDAEAGSNTIRKITPAGVVTTVAGLALASGSIDDVGSAARFNSPQDVTVDSAGNIYVADTDSCTIRKVTSAGVVTTIAGTSRLKGSTDSKGVQALFNFPTGVSVDRNGNLFVADTSNNTVRKIAPDTTVTTVAGRASNAGYLDGDVGIAQFNNPAGIAVDHSRNLYVADGGNNTIRLIAASSHKVSAYAGSGLPGSGGYGDGAPRAARFTSPNALALDPAGNLYVADAGNDLIRVIPSNGTSALGVPLAYSVLTLAGSPMQSGAADGIGTGATFYGPNGLALDSAYNLYVADTGNNTIRKVSTSTAVVTTLAGAISSNGSSDGRGSAARFSYPNGLVATSDGTVYVADNANHTIRKITPAGDVTTFAGEAGTAGAINDVGTAATFNFPVGVTADGGGNLYVADTNNSLIRKIAADGTVTTFAGMAGSVGTTDGAESNALFSSPSGVAADAAGNVYVADSNNQTIRKISTAGVVTTIAGLADTVGSTDGAETNALFFNPQGIALGSDGTLYVADTANETIRKLTVDGTGNVAAVSTLAGVAGVRGYVDGIGTAAQLNSPFGLAVDSAGNVFVADAYNYVIRKITPNGTVSTLAGYAGSAGHADGIGSNARFTTPQNVCVDPLTGNLYVSDTRNNTIRRIDPRTGAVTTVAGAPPEGSAGFADGTTSAARFDEPNGVAVDADGNIYVGDTLNATIRKISGVLTKAADGTVTTGPGTVSTVAGVVEFSGNSDGTGSAAQFWFPYGIAVRGTGSAATIYVADAYNSVIRRIAPGGVVTTYAGISGTRGSTDGAESTALFYRPTSVAVDSANNVYVADNTNNTIRKISPATDGTFNGTVTTLAGLAGTTGYVDDAGSRARFASPTGVAVDSAGNVYVADTGNNTVRMITPAGVVTTLAGSPDNTGTSDGTGADAWFNNPSAVSVDAARNVYVTDSNNQTIRKITPDRVVTTLGGLAGVTGSTDGTGSAALFDYPAGVAADSSGNIFIADTMNNTICVGVPTSASGGSGGGSSGGSSGGGSSGGGGSGGSGGTSGPSVDPRNPGSPNSQAAGQSVVLFLYPTSVARDSSGNLYVADPANSTIQKVTADGVSATLAGLAGTVGTTDATGSNARFNQPNGVTVDGSGSVFVADTGNGTIRKITADGTVTTFAGNISHRGNLDGSGTAAWFSSPTGIAADSTGNLFVADAFTNTIRKVTPAGAVSTVAGSAAIRGSSDGVGSAARFSYPAGVAADGSGNVFVADTYNDTVRKITSAGVVSTLAGDYRIAGAVDGTGSNALFNQPFAVAVDSSGNIYVADTVNCTVRKVTSAGVVTTVAGVAGLAGFADGTSTTMTLFNQPRGLAPDGSGGLYVADTGNAAIRRIAVNGTVSTPAMPQGYVSTGGSIAMGSPPDTTTTSSSGGGGGGAIEPRFLALLALLGISRWLTRKR